MEQRIVVCVCVCVFVCVCSCVRVRVCMCVVWTLQEDLNDWLGLNPTHTATLVPSKNTLDRCSG